MASSPSRRWAASMGTLVLLLAGDVCLAHCDSPPPPPPPSGHLDYAGPQRWSWLHWWEANRDPYLETIRQRRTFQKPDAEAEARFRAKAVEALLEAIGSDRWQLRASAALALGRMEEPSAEARLIEAAKSDEHEAVRQAARLALGLLDSQESVRSLLTQPFATEADREAALVAVGLSNRGGPDVLTGLQATLAAEEVGRATIAAWGLRRRTDPANAKLLAQLVQKSTSPWLVSEGLLSLGCQKAASSIQPLADVLLDTPWGKNIAANRALVATHLERMKVATGAPARREAFALWNHCPNRDPPKPLQRSRNGDPMLGFERVYQARLRASAAIALGSIDHPASRRVLLTSLEGDDDAFTDLHKGMAIMSLGQIGDAKCLPPLLAYLSPEAANGVRRIEAELNSPLRGCAALALGLYARPAPTPQGPTDRPHYEKVCQLLAARMGDRRETLEVRAAAAMGLGLTGRTENLRFLQPASQTVGAKDDLLVGYTLLARGMLGDNNILPAAEKYLAVANERGDTSGILGRRAAALGLGLLGNTQALPALRTAWDLNYYVNREVALAYSLLGAYSMTHELVWLMQRHEKTLGRCFAARCLGELFTARRPQRMALLIQGSNYMVRNDRMAPYCALANEFLYNYLIAAFGDDWR